MQPRVYQITTNSGKSQATPAPLLLTRHGQLPNLPVPLAQLATPQGDTLLLSVPALDWHVINSNSGRGATNLPIPHRGISQLTAHLNAIFVLSVRAAASRQTLCDTPGKSLTVRLDPSLNKGGIAPSDYARLHALLKTDFAIAPTDAPYYNPKSSHSNKTRRALRSIEQCKAFIQACTRQEKLQPDSLFASVQVGIDHGKYHLSKQALSTNHSEQNVNRPGDLHNLQQHTISVCALGAKGGISVDGLYAGEHPDERTHAIRCALNQVKETSTQGLRLLTGGSGAPWDVLRAVSLGIDVMDASFPFDMAERGYATQLVRLQLGSDSLITECNIDMSCTTFEYVNLRDRRWETNIGPSVDGCECFVCKGYSRAYIRHLFEVHEMMGVSLLVAHNLWDYLSWFKLLRIAISSNQLGSFIETYERMRGSHRQVDSSIASPTKICV